MNEWTNKSMDTLSLRSSAHRRKKTNRDELKLSQIFNVIQKGRMEESNEKGVKRGTNT